jgi:hypothetical protein
MTDAAGCLGCVRLENQTAEAVTLLSGAVVCSWCPAWLTETRDRHNEAALVLRMVNRETRRAHLDSREAEFGALYRERLEAAILSLWESQRAALSTEDADDQS